VKKNRPPKGNEVQIKHDSDRCCSQLNRPEKAVATVRVKKMIPLSKAGAKRMRARVPVMLSDRDTDMPILSHYANVSGGDDGIGGDGQ
jgi:hypothetical protein